MKTIQIIAFCIILTACRNENRENSLLTNQKTQISTMPIKEIKEIKEHIELQKRVNTEEEGFENPYSMTSKDLELASTVIFEGLKNNGFKKTTEEDFLKRIKLIFGIENKKSSNYKIHSTNMYISLYGNQNLPYEDLIKNEFYNSIDTRNYYLMLKNHIIIELEYLEDIIKISKDNTYKIIVKPNLVHRNKYLFNSDKASLAWLLNNDKPFLIALLEKYGYDKDPKINKMVLDSIYKEYTQTGPVRGQYIATLFFIKDSYNQLQIREGLLRYVEETTSSTDNRLLYALSAFMDSLYSEDRDHIYNEDPSKKFTELEKAKIIAYFTNIEIPLIEKYKQDQVIWNNATSTFYYLAQEQPQMVELIKKNNYFGLPKLKIMIDETLKQIEVYNEHYHESNP
ncbi:hypothetical protein GCM10022289_17730 [Pedobacter jeongneungensis]|uniref:Uncharacterized protein n=1 Tax=Pedobacter jeongneungensis TaxID=947309 RepID=A0ABP8BB58_9SPHI